MKENYRVSAVLHVLQQEKDPQPAAGSQADLTVRMSEKETDTGMAGPDGQPRDPARLPDGADPTDGAGLQQIKMNRMIIRQNPPDAHMRTDEARAAIDTYNQLWLLDYDRPVEEPRRLRRLAKSFAKKLCAPILRPLISQQADYNKAVTQTLNNLVNDQEIICQYVRAMQYDSDIEAIKEEIGLP